MQNFLITLLDGTEVTVNGVVSLVGYGQSDLAVEFIGVEGNPLYTLQPGSFLGFHPVVESE